MPDSLMELLEEKEAEDPHRRVFLTESGDVLTRRQWHVRSNAFANGLIARGVRPDDKVALVYDNARWFDYVVAWMGVLKAGAVAVPSPPASDRPSSTTSATTPSPSASSARPISSPTSACGP